MAKKIKRRIKAVEWTEFVRGRQDYADGSFYNSIYQVFVFRQEVREDAPRMVHLSIKTHDRSPIRDWRAMQRIKNELCGTTCEAVELYPAESRLIDEANQYHLWVLEPGAVFTFGYNMGRQVSSEPLKGKGRQRPNHHDSSKAHAVGVVWHDWNAEERKNDA